MRSDPWHRALFAARVVALLAAVAVLLVFAARERTNPQDTTAGQATHTASPGATHSPGATPAATSTAGTRVQMTGLSLCEAVPGLVRFSIQVLGSPHQGGAINVSNADIVTKAALVQSVARQFCALPVLPGKPEFCLASLGSWFQLIFGAKDGKYWTVWANSGGCEQVIGAGDQTRTAMLAGPRLWPALVADLRAAHPLSP